MSRDPDRGFFGHPIGLRTLFFTEMWERFSYYGMRAFLILYLTAPKDVGGKGLLDSSAGSVFAVFGASVYLLSLPGGWIADRFIGQRKGVIFGGIGIAIGNVLLAFPSTADLPFYTGLILIAMGTGMLKPNVSTIVGQLYGPTDIRRDAGYTIYYMGINIGASVSPFVCGYLAGRGVATDSFRQFLASHDIDPNMAWHFAFAAAAVGMIAGVIQFIGGRRSLGGAGEHPTIPEDPKRAARDRTVLGAIVATLVILGVLIATVGPTRDTITNVMGIGLVLGSIALFYGLYSSARDAREKRGILAMIPLYLGAIGFFGIFEQAPTTLNLFADQLTRPELFGMNIPPAFYQSVNGVFIVLLAPLFAFIWLRLARAKKEPTSVNKFAIGMVFVALSFVVMLPTLWTVPTIVAPGVKVPESQQVSGMYLIVLYLVYTCAELCISPVGLSSMSKLAPKRLAGMVMGTWFLGTSIGVYLAGRATTISEKNGFPFLFKFLIVAALVMAAALFIVAPVIRKMMALNVDAEGPENKSEKAEPEPLPSARVVDRDKE